MATTAKTSSSKTTKTTAAAPKKASATAARAPKAVASPASPAKKAARPKEAAVKRSRAAAKVDPILRQHYIEVAAYYIAERRGFLGGCANEDWVQAEIEIDQLLADKKLSA